MTRIVAERLYRARGNIPVIARIYAPQRIARSSEWSCWIEIEGLATPYRKESIGVDSYQALESGMYLFSSHLDKVAATLTFQNAPEGHTGTSLIVAWPLGAQGV